MVTLRVRRRKLMQRNILGVRKKAGRWRLVKGSVWWGSTPFPLMDYFFLCFYQLIRKSKNSHEKLPEPHCAL